jgi:hypothetical protein
MIQQKLSQSHLPGAGEKLRIAMKLWKKLHNFKTIYSHDL